MENTLLKLKRILNTLDDEEVECLDLYIDNQREVDVIALDNNAISLITDEKLLKINEMPW